MPEVTFGYVWDMAGIIFCSMLDMFWTCLGHVLHMFRICFGHVLDMIWVCFLGRVFWPKCGLDYTVHTALSQNAQTAMVHKDLDSHRAPFAALSGE